MRVYIKVAVILWINIYSEFFCLLPELFRGEC